MHLHSIYRGDCSAGSPREVEAHSLPGPMIYKLLKPASCLFSEGQLQTSNNCFFGGTLWARYNGLVSQIWPLGHILPAPALESKSVMFRKEEEIP